MKRAHLRVRLWTASIFLGCSVAYALKLITSPGEYGFYFPGTQPGWLVMWAVSAIAPEPLGRELKMAIVTAGNALFYSVLTLRILVADLLSRGRLGQWMLSHGNHRRHKQFA
jgi:hypothetical protein